MGNMKSLNPINLLFSSNQSLNSSNTIVKGRFMPKINREPKDKKFVKISKYTTQYMFKYFDYEELYELGKTSVFFMNNVIEYLENNNTWPEEIRKLISKYGFQIHQGEVDLTLKLTKKNKRRYKYPNEENKGTNYYQFDLDGNRYISIANSFRWAHQDNNNYWTKEKAIGSYEENSDVYYLVNVCWLDTKFHFYHVNPKNNYKLYINEYFVFNKEDFICYIKKEDFNDVQKDQNGDCLVKVEFFHNNNFWKSGWFIDGGCLVETEQDEIDKLKEKEEKEEEKEEEKKEEKRFHLRRFGGEKTDF